jgi:hypothetical protein
MACAYASAGGAQIAERPDIKPGDRWSFVVYYAFPATVPNRHWRIDTVSATVITGTENGEPLVLTPELNVIDSPTVALSGSKALAFPLEVGKRWRYRTDWIFKPKSSRGSSDYEVSVVDYEDVVVPAGRYAAFGIVAKARLRGTSPVNSRYDGEATMTYWYAPSARAIVRTVSHNPYLGTSVVELVEVALER